LKLHFKRDYILYNSTIIMDNVVNVQREVKQNAEEIQDYLRDLNNWTEDIQKKDEQLRKAKKKEDQLLPPIRKPAVETKPGRQKKSVRPSKTNSKTPQEPPAKKEKIKSYEYDKWAKFDIDAACKEVDDNEEEDEEEEDSEEAEELENERLATEAIAEKERGNQYFKAGNWDQAIEHYSKGIQCDPTNPILPANRAMAMLKKKQYGAAERDSSIAIDLDRTYVKAYQRRASARTGLGKIDEAMKDYDKVLQFEPLNKSATAEKEKLMELKKKKEMDVKPEVQKSDVKENIKGIFEEGKTKTVSLEPVMQCKSNRIVIKEDEDESVDPNIVLPISKPPHQRSKKPLKRIEITEVCDANQETRTIDKEDEKLIEKVCDMEIDRDGVTISGSKSKGFTKKN